MRDFIITFFNVGNGHCSYVEFPNGQNALIDIKVDKVIDLNAIINDDGSAFVKYNGDNVIEILKEDKKVSKIDYLFITHPHKDHISGLEELVNNFKIGTFIYSPVYFRPSHIYEDWEIYEKMKKGCYCESSYAAKNGCEIQIGDCIISCLAPFDYLLSNQPENVNNNGLLLKITCRGHKIIIPGDIEEDGWELVNDQDIKDTFLLLASHHGNNSGYYLEKIKVMNLEYVVISAGAKTEHDADQKYRNQVKEKVLTTRYRKVVMKIDQYNVLSAEYMKLEDCMN